MPDLNQEQHRLAAEAIMRNPADRNLRFEVEMDMLNFAINEQVGHNEPLAVAPGIFKKPAIFWGGSDVDPSLYNRPKSQQCGGTNLDGDIREAEEMREYIEEGRPIIGICRGAQLLNVVNGGILVQHIDGHGLRGQHWCDIDWNGEHIHAKVSSTHHQMMVTHKDGIIIGKAPETTGVHWDDVNTPYNYKYVTEVVYYPKTRSLCIQPHPEWMDQGSPFIEWINNFIAEEWGMAPINFADEEAKYQRGAR